MYPGVRFKARSSHLPYNIFLSEKIAHTCLSDQRIWYFNFFFLAEKSNIIACVQIANDRVCQKCGIGANPRTSNFIHQSRLFVMDTSTDTLNSSIINSIIELIIELLRVSVKVPITNHQL